MNLTNLGCLFHSLSVSVGKSPLRALNWFIFLLRLSGSKLQIRMMQELVLCPSLPQHYEIVFCRMRRAEITGCRVVLSLLVVD